MVVRKSKELPDIFELLRTGFKILIFFYSRIGMKKFCNKVLKIVNFKQCICVINLFFFLSCLFLSLDRPRWTFVIFLQLVKYLFYNRYFSISHEIPFILGHFQIIENIFMNCYFGITSLKLRLLNL